MAYPYSTHNDSTATLTRKGSDQDAEVLKEFKRKLAEDEGYIAYFNERIRIEQAYIDALDRLHTKTSAADDLLDEQISSIRRVWNEVRDYSLREINSREAFVNAIKEDVISKLVAVRDTQTRIRNRIREDLKKATDDYEDYAFSKVPKLQRSYNNRMQALEEHKKQEHAIAMQAKLLSEGSPTGTGNDRPHPYASSIASGHTTPAPINIAVADRSSDPEVTSPIPPSPSPVPSIGFQPLSPPERRGITGRARSGSGSLTALRDAADVKSKEVLSDIAAQGKKGFTAIMSRFAGEREGMQVEIPSPVEQSRLVSRGSVSRNSGALKGVKIKRDAEDADKAYRQGVFECESRRLRREKTHQSALTSLSQFNDELNATLQVSLWAFSNAAHGTAATLAQSTNVINSALKNVNLAADTMLYRNRIPPQVRNAPILYKIYNVGYCRSLIFGVSLTDYDFARGEGGDHGRPPLIVEKCIAALDARGLTAEGIYRMSGRAATVKKMVQGIELNEEVFQFTPDDDVYSIAVVLKQYLRELPEPLFPLPQAERVKYTESREQNISNNFITLRARLRRLPPIHQTTFQAILQHLHRVALHLGSNKMDPKNLATVFNTALFGQEPAGTNSNALTMHLEKDTLLEDLITYADVLFSAPTPPTLPIERQEESPIRPELGARAGSGHATLTISPPSGTPAQAAVNLNEEGYQNFEPREFEEHTELVREFTPDDKLDLLFDPDIIPDKMRAAGGDDLHVRPLASNDLLRSHFGLLSHLSTSPPLAPSVYTALFNAIKRCEDTYYIIVYVERETDQIVASGTLINERKYIHGAGRAGHIEDIVLAPSVQGRGLGRALVEGLRDLAVSLGCYKIILDCQEPKVPFYEKCGFKLRGRQMAYYVPEPEPQPVMSPSRASPDRSLSLQVEDGCPPDSESVAETMLTTDTTETTSTGVTYHFPTTTTTTNGSSGTATPGLRGEEAEKA